MSNKRPLETIESLRNLYTEYLNALRESVKCSNLRIKELETKLEALEKETNEVV